MEPVRAVDLVRAWKVSAPYVHKLIKKKGMPIDDFTCIEDATRWREENAVSGVGTRVDNSGGPPKPDKEPGPEPPSLGVESPPEPLPPEEEQSAFDPDDLAGSGLARALENARRAERGAAWDLQEARRLKQFGRFNLLTNNYNKANQGLREASEAVRKEMERRGQLISLDAHKIQLNRLIIPIITLMRKLPRTLGMRVNPAEDAQAEKIIAEEVERAIAEIKRSLTELPDPEYHFNAWLVWVMSDGPEAALKRIDEARAKIEEIQK